MTSGQQWALTASHQYSNDQWVAVSARTVSRMAVTEDGKIWIRDDNEDYSIVDTAKKVDSSFKKFSLAVGPWNTVLATNWANDRLYSLQDSGNWKIFGEQKAIEIAIAKHGRIFLRNSDNQILM